MADVPASPPPADDSDGQLLARFAAGDRSALDELFVRYRQPAFRVAYRLLGQEADALDAVQEGYVKALVNLDSFQGRSSFKTWLMRVVSNAAFDLGRKRGRRTGISLDAGDPDADVDPGLTTWDDPARGLGNADLRRALDAALATLPDAQRETFVLHADGELSYKEIADVLGISIGTVMSRLFYARQRLKLSLTEQATP
ncbi:MAG: RNA polymerase sigma factor [Gemmataceae bacterium]|nr:RNA polymerase sigma factor [Gemmataceae bacterium]